MQGDAQVRNISNTGRRNRFYGSMALFFFAIVVNIAYLIVGKPPMLNPDYDPILIVTAITLSGLYAEIILPFQSDSIICLCHFKSSNGLSVVHKISIFN